MHAGFFRTLGAADGEADEGDAEGQDTEEQDTEELKLQILLKL